MSALEFNTTIKVTGKEGLNALLAKVHYLPEGDNPNHAFIGQVGAYGDIRPFLDLLSIVEDSLVEVQFLRGKDPDLQGQFIKSVENLVQIKNRFIENAQVYKRHPEAGENPVTRSV